MVRCKPRRPGPDSPSSSAAPSRAVAVLALALALAIVATLPLSRPAAADDPSPPSAAAVSAAQAAASRRAAQVAAVEAELATAQTAEQALDFQAEQAVERYNGATVRQQQAEARFVTAAAAAARAAADRQAARRAASALAAEQYRLGVPPALAAFQGLLRAENPRSADIERQALHAVDSQARTVVDEANGTAARAAAASSAAAHAAADARQATVAVEQATVQVQAQLAAQHAQVAQIDAQRITLLVQLALAEQVSVDLARQRQQALAVAAAKAAAEAARQAALAAAARHSSVDGTSGYRPGDASAAVAFARAQLGRPYVWGGAGPDTFDCSGLTMRAWEHAGVELPHFAADQYAESTPLSYSQIRPGDLVFWSHNGSPQDIYHVAIYLGDDQMIEAPRTGDVVKTASLWIMGTPTFYACP
ncbi:cell wall-associated NlpC family hydrolase [Streptacidiphilus sp. MAP12-16]|uniref:C40 family peptidase n=1 Tax=Streptacidiphilus sp. MAP12-16 TaxID=3156300 RepID=UPI003512A59D